MYRIRVIGLFKLIIKPFSENNPNGFKPFRTRFFLEDYHVSHLTHLKGLGIGSGLYTRFKVTIKVKDTVRILASLPSFISMGDPIVLIWLITSHPPFHSSSPFCFFSFPWIRFFLSSTHLSLLQKFLFFFSRLLGPCIEKQVTTTLTRCKTIGLCYILTSHLHPKPTMVCALRHKTFIT